MVSLKTILESNSRVANLPQGLVALFIGATSGIGQSALEHFVKHARSPRIYTVARPQTAASHEAFLSPLRQSNPGASITLITADHALVSDIDKAVDAVIQKETKLDLLFLSAGFIAFEGRVDTVEGLDPSMTTRYYTRLRAVQRLLPLLNAAARPRVVSVLAAGLEKPIREDDLDLREPGSWAFWPASEHANTMGTLALERLAAANPRLSVVHWLPGPVSTPGMARIERAGLRFPDQMSQDEAGARALFLATSDRYAADGGEGGLVAAPEGLEPVRRSGGGIFLINPLGESTDNEAVLADMRERGVPEVVWRFTQKVFDDCVARGRSL
ncbi:hypothetical protein EsH8_II_000466 [Colletotrichum jinshuiense]